MNQLIPKNTSVLVTRVPSIPSNIRLKTVQNSSKNWKEKISQQQASTVSDKDISRTRLSEEDKIDAMIAQSAHEYDTLS